VSDGTVQHCTLLYGRSLPGNRTGSSFKVTSMKRTLISASAAILLMTASSASPLKVRTLGSKAQQVVICPECSEKLSCAKVGDYLIGLDVNLDSPKTGAATVSVHLMDQNKKPVTDAKATLALSMPSHGHKRELLHLRNSGHGRFEAATVIVMPGAYQADVEVSPAGGDRIRRRLALAGSHGLRVAGGATARGDPLSERRALRGFTQSCFASPFPAVKKSETWDAVGPVLPDETTADHRGRG
jgi:hypothetical protein